MVMEEERVEEETVVAGWESVARVVEVRAVAKTVAVRAVEAKVVVAREAQRTLYCMPLGSVITPSLSLLSARNFSPTALEPCASTHEDSTSPRRSMVNLGDVERKLDDEG
mgnify:CR=1 FL=1